MPITHDVAIKAIDEVLQKPLDMQLALAVGKLMPFLTLHPDTLDGVPDLLNQMPEGNKSFAIVGYLISAMAAAEAAQPGAAPPGLPSGTNPWQGAPPLPPATGQLPSGSSARGDWGRLDDESVAERLCQLYGHAFCQGRACPTLAKRTAPIPACPGGLLSDVGDYFPLVGYERALDSFIRALCSLQRRFKPEHLHQFHRQLQLLRVVGAPGLGKTTFVSAVWGMVLPRLAQLLEQGLPPGWGGYDMDSIKQLHARLAQSWAAGPLVFTLDMSHDDMKRLHPLEASHSDAVQAGARMLWATLDGKKLGMAVYSSLLSHLATDRLLLSLLNPHCVMLFVHKAAQLGRGTPSMVCFVWDEVNAVQPATGQAASFVQLQVSAAVDARRGVLCDKKLGTLDMLPVLVTATTRGSAASLAPTASRKAMVRDLLLPLPQDLQLKQLVVADVVRRLDLPAGMRAQLGVGRDVQLASLSERERASLAATCPPHVVEVLRWTGGNMRTLELALGALSGQVSEGLRNTSIGKLKWWKKHEAVPSLPRTISLVADALVNNGWSCWLDSLDVSSAFMLQAVARAQCGVRVTRSTVLARGAGKATDVTVQQLEADGVIELRFQGEEVKPQGGNNNTDPGVCLDPDCEEGGVQMQVVLPPLLLVAYLRRLRREESRSAKLDMIKSLAESWRSREYDDVSALTLRLQLWRDALRCNTVELGLLLPPLALAGHVLAGVRVAVPGSGFQVFGLHTAFSKELQVQLVTAVATGSPDPDRQPPWCFVFAGNGGPDGMVVLRECDAAGHALPSTVVISVQSKLRSNPTSVTWAAIVGEAQKVPMLSRTDVPGAVTQLFLFVTDQHPSSRELQRAASTSGQGPEAQLAGPDGLAALAQGKVVPDERGLGIMALLRDEHWQLPAAVRGVHELLSATPAGLS